MIETNRVHSVGVAVVTRRPAAQHSIGLFRSSLIEEAWGADTPTQPRQTIVSNASGGAHRKSTQRARTPLQKVGWKVQKGLFSSVSRLSSASAKHDGSALTAVLSLNLQALRHFENA